MENDHKERLRALLHEIPLDPQRRQAALEVVETMSDVDAAGTADRLEQLRNDLPRLDREYEMVLGSRKERQRCLDLIGASRSQRELYERGFPLLTEERAKELAERVETAIANAPAAIEAADRLIAKAKEKR